MTRTLDPSGAEARALDCFAQGLNCSESVLQAIVAELGLDPSVAKAATAFGGGVGRQGSLCGALTGAVIGIGLARGRTDAADGDARDRSYALAAQMYQWFGQTNGARECSVLIGMDLATPEGFAAYRSSGLKDAKCSGFVAKAAAKAIDLINNS